MSISTDKILDSGHPFHLRQSCLRLCWASRKSPHHHENPSWVKLGFHNQNLGATYMAIMCPILNYAHAAHLDLPGLPPPSDTSYEARWIRWLRRSSSLSRPTRCSGLSTCPPTSGTSWTTTAPVLQMCPLVPPLLGLGWLPHMPRLTSSPLVPLDSCLTAAACLF